MANRTKKIQQARALQANGDVAGAIEVYEKYLKKHPRDIAVVVALADQYIDLNEADLAHQTLLAAKPFGRNDVGFTIRLAQSYNRKAHIGLAEEVMSDLASRIRNDAKVFRILGDLRNKLQNHVGAAEAWQAAVDLEPDNIRANVQLAISMSNEHTLFEQSLAVAHRAEALAAGDILDLMDLADCHLAQERFGDAARVYGRVLEIASPKQLQLTFFVSYLRALLALGDPEPLSAIKAAALEFVDQHGGHFQRRALEFQYVSKELAAARVRYAAGEGDAVLSELPHLYGEDRGCAFEYGAHSYLPDTDKRLKSFQGLIGGRDAVMMLPGPSLSGLKPFIENLCAGDVFFAGMNKFDEIECNFLAPYGRFMETVLMVDRREWLRRQTALKTWLGGIEPRMFLTQGTVWSFLKGQDEDFDRFLQDNPDRWMWFSGRSLAPPSHRNPLNVAHTITLGALLPLIVVGRPRRVFIFGADGGAQVGGSGEVYFHGGTALDAEDQSKLNEAEVSSEKDRYSELLAKEARHFDATAPFVVASLAALHDVPVPEIYICAPGSGYRAYPQIKIEAAMEMILSNKPLAAAC